MRFCLLAMLLFSLAGCSHFRCGDGRPTVLNYSASCVLDYNSSFQEFCFSAEEVEIGRAESLTPDMFDPHQAIDENYGLSCGDIVEISIQGEEETTIENAMVAPDGKLYYSVLDGVPAAGRRPDEVAMEMQRALGTLFISPVVSIVPKDFFGLNFYILGRVKMPGAYPIKGPVTLSEGIAEAGGLLSHQAKDYDYARRYLVPYVDLENSFLVRNNKKLDIDFRKLMLEGDARQNIYLKPEDYIYIAPAEEKEIFVLGALLAPRRLTCIPGMTLMQALGIAGGWQTPGPYSADLKQVIVIRGSLQRPKVCCVDVEKILLGEATDLWLYPGDIVYANDKLERFGREMVLFAVTTFFDTFSSAAGSYIPRAYWWGSINAN